MIVSMILASSQNGVIGVNNRLPWHLPADLKYFKNLTMGHHIVMGRKTYESIGRPLPGRTSVVITRQKNYRAEGCLIAHSMQEAIELCKDDDEIFIIGGATIYEQTLHYAKRIYLTMIYQDFDGDTFLFDIDRSIWKETAREDLTPDEKNKYHYSFIVLEKE